MSEVTGQFRIVFPESAEPARTFRKDRILLGRLETSDVVLDDLTVSRIHAGITFRDSRFILSNLSTSNVLALNGRVLPPEQSDVLTDGDVIQIGPFAIRVSGTDDAITLSIQQRVATGATPADVHDSAPPDLGSTSTRIDDVLKVFWEKRSREKEEWGSRLRPTEKPIPGKALYNWRPTGDLRRPWRVALFIWAFLLIGAVGAVAFFNYPNAYAPLPIASAHAIDPGTTGVAVASNGNSCTTCHTPNDPVENACIRCHQADEFHSSNTRAHEESGITCTVCHREHQGVETDLNAQAIASCAECHNDANTATYNGRKVGTPHGGSYGYPAEAGVWKWKGVYTEVAAAVPEINNSATGDPDEQAKLSRQFHTIHVGRLAVPPGLVGDARGLVSCSSCHKTFEPVDRVTPRETCAMCHTTSPTTAAKDTRFAAGSVNCISCHVQHPYSSGRWREFLTEDAVRRRREAVIEKIGELRAQ